MKRLNALLLAPCLFMLLTAGRCENQIEAAITKTDEFIVANKKIFDDACTAGQTAHDQIVALQKAGLPHPWSAKDIADELAAYNAGVALCAAGAPTDIITLLRVIPRAQAWVNALAKWAKPG